MDLLEFKFSIEGVHLRKQNFFPLDLSSFKKKTIERNWKLQNYLKLYILQWRGRLMGSLRMRKVWVFESQLQQS